MTLNEKAPGAVGAAAEGGIPTQQGRDMSDTTPTLTHAQEDALIRAWAHDFAGAIERSGWEAPLVPRELWPSWAVDVDVQDAGAGEATITFTGTAYGDTACLERFYTVVVRDPHNAGSLGTWETEGTKVWADVLSEDITLTAAVALAAALAAAAFAASTGNREDPITPEAARALVIDLTAAAEAARALAADLSSYADGTVV